MKAAGGWPYRERGGDGEHRVNRYAVLAHASPDIIALAKTACAKMSAAISAVTDTRHCLIFLFLP